jgi:type III pantothenate kinase
MKQNQLVFVIDAGNTCVKIGVFRSGELEKVLRLSSEKLASGLKKEIVLEEGFIAVLSSVIGVKETNDIEFFFGKCLLLDHYTPLPIALQYETPHTLGFDRICNAVASSFLAKGRNAVSIDIGTCIKFDCVEAKRSYIGGSISPGIGLRYRSMKDYTGRLPLIEDRLPGELIGKDTLFSMRSGVMNGIRAEIIQFIHWYREQYQDLTFFVTGGDAVYFDFGSKNDIFVNENLTLIGLYQIFLFNAY